MNSMNAFYKNHMLSVKHTKYYDKEQNSIIDEWVMIRETLHQK